MTNPLTLPKENNTIPSILEGVDVWGKIEEYLPGKWRLRGTWAKKRYTFYWYVDGKHLDDHRLTVRLQERISSEIDSKTFDPGRYLKNNPLSFSNVATTWAISSPCSEEWKIARKRIVENILIPFFGSVDIREIRSVRISEFYAHLKENNKWGDKSIYNIMGELRAMLKRYADEIPKLPSFPKLTYQVPGIRRLTYEQQEKVFEFIPDGDKPIFNFWRHTGCRPNEARGFLRENILFEEDYLLLATVSNRAGEIRENTKTKKVKIFAITPEVAEAIKPRHLGRLVFMHFDLRHKKLKPYSRSMLWRIWTKANKEANGKYGIPIVNPYNAFRHSFGCQKVSEGVPMEAVQQMYGHSSIKTTQRYAEYNIEQIREWMRPKVVRIGQKQKAEGGRD